MIYANLQIHTRTQAFADDVVLAADGFSRWKIETRSEMILNQITQWVKEKS